MSNYITPIFSGIIVSLLIIYLSIIPVMIYQYRKYNGVLVKRNIVMFSFVVYMLTAWFMTILPLPSIETVVDMKTIEPNLVPFKFVQDFIEKSGFVISNPKTWLHAIKSPSFYTVAFNVLLTYPFGIYLRKYFKLSLGKTILCGVLLSLFYEITQYTGLYGIYPKAYRLADIDDVMVNTLGTVLGYLTTPIVGRLLPKLESSKDKNTSAKASLIRRGVALIVDFIILDILYGILVFIFSVLGAEAFLNLNIGEVIYSYIYFITMPLVYNGETFGMKLLKIKIVNENNSELKFKEILIRNGILVSILKLTGLLSIILNNLEQSIIVVLLALGLGLAPLIFYLYVFIKWIFKRNVLFYEKISKTRTVVDES
ncbi:Glycopeptide antibiotics resistance protein [Anaerosphaera aminiphila DSM 21120]|uniref:Glycopeptide antibiotics resistance protein n=1 Tax=Anaerosphaera aminiphila DSM 21120 TaxID=1120995 RepID=A0A1M5PRF4_9FIRM|nr:VanZ family protein [Anaerosphaera aminiphila]SHH03903.1 Glycopeptide antibiotics resistance protein [Anaerosphaera aminiphila DSM 21120]